MDAAFVWSAAGVAVIVTTFGDGARFGAVKIALLPLAEIAPHSAPEQPVPEIAQLTAVLGFEFATGVSVAV
jgi:hypothetical protein